MRPLITLTFILLCPFAFSATIHVPDDYSKIQDAIDAAVNGDTVLVAPGTYKERIDFLGKEITVKSSGGACVTVIDGKNYNTVVTFASGEGPDTLLEGFTITNGRGTFIWPNIMLAGGIYCEASSPTISCNAIIENNIYIPGVACFGGGIYCISSSPMIVNNLIADNSSATGGGLYLYGGSPQLINNTVMHNTADFEGGGLLCRHTNCVIFNTIFWENTASVGPQISLTYPDGPSVLTISDSDVDGGQASVNVDSGCTLNWGAGMIDADPLFVDSANSDYHITYNSPCRDAGDNSVVSGCYDFEGDPRIACETVDMGADEFHTHLYIKGDQTPGGDIQGKLVGLPGTSPVRLFIGLGGIRPTPLPTAYGDLWLLPPRLSIPLIPIPSNGVLAVSTTIPLSPPAPYDLPMQGLVGLNSDSLTNLCVLNVR